MSFARTTNKLAIPMTPDLSQRGGWGLGMRPVRLYCFHCPLFIGTVFILTSSSRYIIWLLGSSQDAIVATSDLCMLHYHIIAMPPCHAMIRLAQSCFETDQSRLNCREGKRTDQNMLYS